MADSGKKRILCIHGFRASPTIMDFQTSPLKGALKNCEFVYMPGRLETQTPCDPMTGSMFPPPYYCNWDRELTGGTLSEAVMGAVEDTRKYIAEKGPFHAVIGFSQGAALVTVLLSLQQKANSTPLPVVACVCGVRPDHRNEAPELNELIASQTPLKCANVQLLGKTDPLRPKGLELKEVFDSTNQHLLEHSKGHQFPPWQEKDSNTAFAAAMQALLDASPPDALFKP